MNNHTQADQFREWLGAYLDGELSGERRAWVEDHLGGCADCRAELAELRGLTEILHADPAPAASQSAEAFAGQVVGRLPKTAQPFWPRMLRTGLRYAPLGMFGVWAFFQAVIWVTGGLLLTLNLVPTNAQGPLLSLLPLSNPGGASSTPGWLADLLTAAGLSGPAAALQNTAQTVDNVTNLGGLVLINLSLIVILGIVFAAWLAGLWVYRQKYGQDTSENGL